MIIMNGEKYFTRTEAGNEALKEYKKYEKICDKFKKRKEL